MVRMSGDLRMMRGVIPSDNEVIASFEGSIQLFIGCDVAQKGDGSLFQIRPFSIIFVQKIRAVRRKFFLETFERHFIFALKLAASRIYLAQFLPFFRDQSLHRRAKSLQKHLFTDFRVKLGGARGNFKCNGSGSHVRNAVEFIMK